MLLLKKLPFRDSGPLNAALRLISTSFPTEKSRSIAALDRIEVFESMNIEQVPQYLFLKSSGEGRSRWNAASFKNSSTTCLTEA